MSSPAFENSLRVPRPLFRCAAASLILLAACGPTTPAPIAPTVAAPASSASPDVTIATPSRGAASDVAVVAGEDPEEKGDLGPIPVTKADPSWGSPTAPVTIVEFGDLQCPYCMRAAATLSELQKTYGDQRLRIVWKNNPLAFHPLARPAAETATALYQERGPGAFWTYYEAIFLPRGGAVAGPFKQEQYDDALRQTGVSRSQVERMWKTGLAAKKVDADIALASRLGATGTPAFFINGVLLSGAQPIDQFTKIIDAELLDARRLLDSGVSPARLYATAATKNFAQKAAANPAPIPAADDKTVHMVPVGDSPVRGNPSALVTMVVFSDFQCPFCARVEPTVDQLMKDYGDRLRVVWKNSPLPFHPRAEPAAELALEARAQRGDAGFWKVHDLLFADNRKLEDADLEAIAGQAGLSTKGAMSAVKSKRHAARIEVDLDLADDLEASGTPHFFINGRRLVGAQPLEAFKTMIDQEVAHAQDLIRQGTPKAHVYDAILKRATPLPSPPKVVVPAPTKDNPTKGPAGAKVTLHVFGDFQCPFTKRLQPTLLDLMAAFPGQIRLVWHNLPLPMHPQARLAAQASLEAYRQKGADGFWKMHDLLFEDQSETALGRQGLDQAAQRMGLQLREFDDALDRGRHDPAIEADIALSKAANVTGTPGVVINGYSVSGAQPIEKFKKVVRRALEEAQPGAAHK